MCIAYLSADIALLFTLSPSVSRAPSQKLNVAFVIVLYALTHFMKSQLFTVNARSGTTKHSFMHEIMMQGAVIALLFGAAVAAILLLFFWPTQPDFLLNVTIDDDRPATDDDVQAKEAELTAALQAVLGDPQDVQVTATIDAA